MITKDNLAKHEFTGLDVSLVKGNNPEITGVNGTIIDETKSMFTLNTKNGIKCLPKNFNLWEFNVGGNSIAIDGKRLEKRPFERLVIKQ